MQRLFDDPQVEASRSPTTLDHVLETAAMGLHFFGRNKTRLGAAGWSQDYKEVFKAAADNASRALGCVGEVEIVWLAGCNGEKVHARLINEESEVERGKASLEVCFRLNGPTDRVLPFLTKIIIRVLQRLT